MDLSALCEQAEQLRVPPRSSSPDATTENVMAAILIAMRVNDDKTEGLRIGGRNITPRPALPRAGPVVPA